MSNAPHRQVLRKLDVTVDNNSSSIHSRLVAEMILLDMKKTSARRIACVDLSIPREFPRSLEGSSEASVMESGGVPNRTMTPHSF